MLITQTNFITQFYNTPKLNSDTAVSVIFSLVATLIGAVEKVDFS